MTTRQPTPEQLETLSTHGSSVHEWAVQSDGVLRVTMYDGSSVFIKEDGKHDRQREKQEDEAPAKASEKPKAAAPDEKE